MALVSSLCVCVLRVCFGLPSHVWHFFSFSFYFSLHTRPAVPPVSARGEGGGLMRVARRGTLARGTRSRDSASQTFLFVLLVLCASPSLVARRSVFPHVARNDTC